MNLTKGFLRHGRLIGNFPKILEANLEGTILEVIWRNRSSDVRASK